MPKSLWKKLAALGYGPIYQRRKPVAPSEVSEQLASIASSVGAARVPDDYRDLLIATGGVPMGADYVSFPCQEIAGGEAVFEVLFGLGGERTSYSLANELGEASGKIPPMALPIGMDSRGDLVCLDLRASSFGQVLFAVFETGSMYSLANSLSAWIELLTPED